MLADYGRYWRFRGRTTRFGDLGGLTQDFESAKSKFEAANAKLSLFTKSPVTKSKYNKLNDEKKAIMLSGGPEGGQVDDSVVKRWISEAQGVVNDINSLYQTYIVNKQGTPLTGSVLSSPPIPFGQDQIFGMNKWLVYGLGGLAVAGILTYIMPKKPAPLKMSEV